MHIPSLTSSHTQQALEPAAKALSTGKRITSAAVDPSGLAVASALTAQADGFDQGARNAQDAINASSVAQGAVATISDAAQRLHALSIRANNDFLSAGDRAHLAAEAEQNTQEIDNIAGRTNFNGLHLLDGNAPTAGVQTGASEGSVAGLTLPASDSAALGLSHIDLSSSASASTSESSIDATIALVGNRQATLGSQTVALEFDRRNSETASNNLTASASNIADADIATTATKSANQQASSNIQIALQVQANFAASSLLGLVAR